MWLITDAIIISILLGPAITLLLWSLNNTLKGPGIKQLCVDEKVEDILWNSTVTCANRVYDDVKLTEYEAVGHIKAVIGNPEPGWSYSPEESRKCFRYMLGIVRKSVDMIDNKNPTYMPLIGNTRNEVVGLIGKLDDFRKNKSKRRKITIYISSAFASSIVWIILTFLYQTGLIPSVIPGNPTFDFALYVILLIILSISFILVWQTIVVNRDSDRLKEAFE